MMTPECKKQEQREGAGEKKTEGCDVSGGGEAGQRPGEWSGNGPKQHAIMSFFFPPPITHSSHHQALFIFRLGNAGPPESCKTNQ